MSVHDNLAGHLLSSMTSQIIESKSSYAVAGGSILLGATLAELQSWLSIWTLFLGASLSTILIIRNIIGALREYRELKRLKEKDE